MAAGADAARAERLDRSACKQLESELAHVVATGVRTDMQKGAEWARANLPPERLKQIKHLIEIEEQLEFRCDKSHSGVAAVAPRERPLAPETPQRKREAAGTSAEQTRAIDAPAASGPAEAAVVDPDAAPALDESATAHPAAADTAPGKIAKDEAEALKESTEVVGDDAKRDAGKVVANKVAGPAKKAAAQAPADAARPAASRPRTKNAYISPSEVNPFFVTGTPR
jgi:hypothetical protein